MKGEFYLAGSFFLNDAFVKFRYLGVTFEKKCVSGRISNEK